jgi:hypothetical protein
MPPVNKDHAKNIAKKVNNPGIEITSRIDTSPKAHDLVCIYYKGLRIASFGIRRGSKHDQGHGHIPKELHLSPRQTVLFAQCTLSIEQWLQILRDANQIDDDEANSAE